VKKFNAYLPIRREREREKDREREKEEANHPGEENIIKYLHIIRKIS
jgi:hypothetical protein